MSGLPPLPSPGGYERAYAESYDLAFNKLRQADLADVCRKSGAVPVDANTVRLRFLNRDYQIDRLADAVTLGPETEPMPIAERLLILHYLVTAGGTPPGTEQISFKEVPEGVVYYPTFYKRAIRPLLPKFGATPANLIPAAAMFGGCDAHQGDAAVTIQAFPKVAITWVLWRGDDEFPAEGTILVDRNIQDYLPTEDIVVLCQTIAIKLCRAV
ncbi:MAG: hypothetical protein C0390_07930 [Syntrophus sp. (in: bacteria)]|nr:hypothetical protein [Syntrophus sp. (in: bacteria)]